MPKRPPTPPIYGDTTLITVWNPWPASLEIDDSKGIKERDQQQLCLWLACIVDPDDLMTIYWKPKSQGTVLIELLNYEKYERMLLGSHKWFELFKTVKQDFRDNDSRIFPCGFANYSVAEKYAWKKHDVQAKWFSGWNDKKHRFVTDPYPKPTFCQLPGDTEFMDVAKRLPERIFPEAAVRPAPKVLVEPKATVPGAAAWQQAKASGRAIPRQQPRNPPQGSAAPKPPQQRNTRPVKKANPEGIVDEQALKAMIGPVPEFPATSESVMVPERFDWFEDTDGLDVFSWGPSTGLSGPSKAETPPALDPAQTWGGAPSWDDEPAAEPEPAPPTPSESTRSASTTSQVGSKKGKKPDAQSKNGQAHKASSGGGSSAWQKGPPATASKSKPPASPAPPPSQPRPRKYMDPSADAGESSEEDPVDAWAANAAWGAQPSWDDSPTSVPSPTVQAPVPVASKSSNRGRGGAQGGNRGRGGQSNRGSRGQAKKTK